MVKKNRIFGISKSIFSTIIASILLFILYIKGIKTFGLISVLVSIAASIFSTLKINNNSRIIYVSLIFSFICILSFSFDAQIEHKVKADETVGTYDEEVINEERIDAGSISDSNFIANDVIKEVTTSVSFSTPTQIENELQSEISYIPDVDREAFKNICFLKDTFRANIPDIKEYHLKLSEVVKEKITSYLHTEEGYSLEELNMNNEIGKLVQQASEIDKLIKRDNTVENYKKLIDIYSQAFVIAPCSSISLQLSRPYEEIILHHARENNDDCDQIFVYGTKGIEYFIQTLSYETLINSTESDIFYRIAKIYHYLGDLPNLKVEIRTELYQIASAYYELSIAYQGYNDIYSIHKPYYCAIVNHKLGVISEENNYFYLERAIRFYNQSLSYDSISTSMYADSNKFASEVCNKLVAFINKYGHNDNIKSKEFYEELSEEYKSKARYE